MKLSHLFLIFAILCTIAWVPLSDTYKTLEIGSLLPKSDYKMIDISGTEISLNDVKGKNGLLVMFSCNTCPYVIAWEDRYPLIAKQCKANNIGFILVNSNEAKRQADDSYEAMKIHAKKNNYAYYYAVDKNSELANDFGASRTPHSFLFNKNDILVYQGGIDDNYGDKSAVTKPYLKNALNAVGSGKKVVNTVLRSPGCSIKRL